MSALRYNEFRCSNYTPLVSLFGFLIFSTEAAPTGIWFFCNFNTNRTNPEFHANLDSLLSSLASNAAVPGDENGFHEDVEGWGTPDIINGQYVCFGDFNASVCEECVQAATKEIGRCINQTESVIWYDDCMLLYQNRSYSFDDMYDNSLTVYERNTLNIPDSEMKQGRFNELLDSLLHGLASKAVNSQSKKFATGQSDFADGKTIYSSVQCVPDLNTSRCLTCLESAISKISICCAGSRGVRFLVMGCNIRYEMYPFYTITPSSNQPAVSQPATGKKGIETQTIIVILVPVSVAVMLSCVGCYLLQRKMRKRSSRILKGNFGEESDTLKSLQFSLAIVEASTNMFSSENVIGKGGFGEVYKVITDQFGTNMMQDRPTMAIVVSYLSNPSVELPIPREPAFLTQDRIAIESGSSQSTNKSTQFSVNEMSRVNSFLGSTWFIF